MGVENLYPDYDICNCRNGICKRTPVEILEELQAEQKELDISGFFYDMIKDKE